MCTHRYLNWYGHGLVIYWFGYVDDLQDDDGTSACEVRIHDDCMRVCTRLHLGLCACLTHDMCMY